ncbi:MAG: HEAT repeat domain-containing protein, partial [Candidatus Methanoperedens sp.]
MPLDYNDLRDMKKRQDIEGLLNILETGDIKECREAIRMLGELRTRKAISPLIGFLETDDVQIRSNAAWALGEIGHVKAVLPLIGLLNDPIENVRINAAWSLGRIGDKRALTVLRSARKNGSTELRKHAQEAIARIESNENDKWRNCEDADIPDIVDIPLIEIEVPSYMECNYISRVEDADTQTDYENMAKFSRNVQVRDTGDPLSEDDTRKIVLGLKDDSKGLVSVDIIFKYKDNTNGERKSSSVWLQMASVGANGDNNNNNKTEREIERIDSGPKYIKRTEGTKKKEKIKHSRKSRPVEYDLPEETELDQ